MNRKLIRTIIPMIAICFIIFLGSCSPDITKTGAAVNINADSSWVFTARRSIPQSPAGAALNGSYTVAFEKNSLVVYLPYFGRAYAGADIFSGKSPLDFTSRDFSMTHSISSKGNLEIIIKPTDYHQVQTMNLTVYNNGNANLRITMTSRSPMTFDGVVTQKY